MIAFCRSGLCQFGSCQYKIRCFYWDSDLCQLCFICDTCGWYFQQVAKTKPIWNVKWYQEEKVQPGAVAFSWNPCLPVKGQNWLWQKGVFACKLFLSTGWYKRFCCLLRSILILSLNAVMVWWTLKFIHNTGFSKSQTSENANICRDLHNFTYTLKVVVAKRMPASHSGCIGHNCAARLVGAVWKCCETCRKWGTLGGVSAYWVCVTVLCPWEDPVGFAGAPAASLCRDVEVSLLEIFLRWESGDQWDSRGNDR